MLSSVVSLAVGLLGFGQLSSQELAVWKRIESSVVMIEQGDRIVGPAALIDARGFFVAHKSVVLGGKVRGRRSNGELVEFDARATDEASQLVLLEASGWQAASVSPFTVVSDRERPGARLLAVIGQGPMRAQVSSQVVFGLVDRSQRAAMLTPVEFEVPLSQVAGAILFSLDGRLVGPIAGTLGTDSVRTQFERNVAQGLANRKSFGPAAIATGYTLGPNVVRRVVDGFRSPGFRVQHPRIGVFCVDEPGGGALVQTVEKGSPGYLIGLRTGDVVLALDGRPVRNQVELSSMIFECQVGQIVRITYVRDRVTTHASIVVGT
ncbi:MAG: serine protease [Fimbriimonadaceae bacterium]|nr:serine protease [Fimbriimonadaceae bacterium]